MTTRAWRRLGRNLTRWMSIGYFRSLKRRVGALETVLDTLLASPTYVPDAASAFNGQAGRVPWDDGYGFDDYGFGRSLTLGCFGRLFRELGLMAYFPTLAAADETGARSGCVVLARRGSEAASRLDEISLLRSIAVDRARA